MAAGARAGAEARMETACILNRTGDYDARTNVARCCCGGGCGDANRARGSKKPSNNLRQEPHPQD